LCTHARHARAGIVGAYVSRRVRLRGLSLSAGWSLQWRACPIGGFSMSEQPDEFHDDFADVSVLLMERLTVAGLEEIEARERAERERELQRESERERLLAEGMLAEMRERPREWAPEKSEESLPQGAPLSLDERVRRDERWSRAVMHELYLFICTKDKKYSKVRKQLMTETGHTQLVIVTTIAAAIGASLGTIAAAVVPIVALFLKILLMCGTEGWCAAYCASIRPIA